MTTQTQIILEDWPVAVPGSLVVWRKRLAEARERGEFTQQDELDIESWGTCAVGECLGFPGSSNKAWKMLGWKDAALGYVLKQPHYRHGQNAARAVHRNDFDGFEAILTELEALPRP